MSYNSKYTGAEVEALLDAANGKQDKIEDLDAIRSGAAKGATALQSYTEQYKGTITGVAINGTAIATSGVAYIPSASTESYGTTKLNSSTNSTSTAEAATPSAVKAAYDLANGKQDKLVSGTNIKTINGASILGSGNITIEGGSSGNYAEVEQLGDTLVANVQGFNTGNNVYGLPDADSAGDADDYLVSRNTLKTINGESLVGEGDITISGGGGDDIRYFTDFTVEDFIEGVNREDTIAEDATSLLDAIRNNKVVCVPYRNYDKGYKIASYVLFDTMGEGEISLYIESEGIQYEAISSFGETLYGNRSINYTTKTEYDEHSRDVSFIVQGNTIYEFRTLDNLYFAIDNVSIPSTIKFIASDDFTIEVPIEIHWANGVVPQFEGGVYYELSLSQIYNEVNAVLTPFK